MEEQDPIISQARRREQLMAGVPKLVDMICLLFQSVGRSIITKEELIHKLVAGHLDIVDRSKPWFIPFYQFKLVSFPCYVLLSKILMFFVPRRG